MLENNLKIIDMPKKKSSPKGINKIGEIISNLMDACGIDATELAEQTNLPCSTISRLRSNATESSPNLSSLFPIANFFCISISQLIGEEPIPYIQGKYNPARIKRQSLPVLHGETILEYLQHKNRSTLPLIHVDTPVSTESFAYFLQGNAMEPQFPDGTLLIIDPNIEIENLDHILVIPTNKKLPLFRQILIEGEERYLRTLNPTFNEFIKLTSKSHTILGVMIESRRNFKNMEFSLNNSNLKTFPYIS